jgi:hydroxymethylpyrimidine kinase/phosphomethylpyrimidine kinase/thiamine-phosphate diphosphorylase
MIAGLYLITDDDRDGRLLQRVAAALRGGVRTVQYRSKTGAAGGDPATARRLADLCRAAGATFLVNDSPELAAACGADGVHLGQGDLPVSEARKLLGAKRIIGVSTRTVDQALKAESQGADYVAVGSIFPTTTKSDAVHVGLEVLHKVRLAVRIPIVAIGGIERQRAAEVIDAGADALAVISAIMNHPAPALAARELALLFQRKRPLPHGRVMTIAGSDSGGGAGVQADLKTITLLGGYGMSAITALTAQNTLGVRNVHPVPPTFVGEQIEVVLSDLGTDTVKTGMLFSADIAAVVAEAIERHALLAVVDPVMVAKGGSLLLEPSAIDLIRQVLLPQAYLLTPNLPEAEALTGVRVSTEADLENVVHLLQELGPQHVLLKGGHLPGDPVDLLLTGTSLLRFPAERIETRSTHGTGCTYSAAIATFLAQGEPLVTAVERAKRFITEAIRAAAPLGSGHGPVNHWQGAQEVLSSRF